MTRGIGAFVLFMVVYAFGGSVAGVFIVYSFTRLFLKAPPSDGSAFDIIIQSFSSVLAGYFGVVLGTLALGVVMKNYPARGIGAAFVTWLLANYLLHFLFFQHSYIPDFEIYTGLLQSLVAAVTAWFTFRLPPFAAQVLGADKNQFDASSGRSQSRFSQISSGGTTEIMIGSIVSLFMIAVVFLLVRNFIYSWTSVFSFILSWF